MKVVVVKMQVISKLNQIFDRRTKVKLVILLIAIIIGALLEVLALSIISPFISILLDTKTIYTNQYIKFVYDLLGFSTEGPFLALLAFVLASVYIIRGIYLYFVANIQNHFIARRKAELSVKLLKKVLDYPYLYHTRKNIVEMQRVVVDDVDISFSMINCILLLLTDWLVTLFIFIFLVIVSPAMTLFVLIMAAICATLYLKIFRKKIKTSGLKNRESYIGMTKAVNQSIGGIKEVKVLHRESFFLRIFKASSVINVKHQARFLTINIVPRLVIETVCFGGTFALLSILLLAGMDISELVPQLSMFVIAAFRLLPSIGGQIANISRISFYRPSIDPIHKIITDDEFENISRVLKESEIQTTNIKDIVVKDLTFKYPDTQSPVLDNVSFSIPENKSIAFVGSSGAGKTTLADLILGILSPSNGFVYYDGKSIHHDNDAWSKKIGYIPQQIYLLDESIIENVAFGIDRDLIDENKVRHALEQAQLTDFINSLPDGVETIVGDRGIRLSGGQRQRIGIARAMYEDPPILVLDEATSSLDDDTEKAVMESVMGFHGNKTMVIIAHRLSTIEHCDIVYRVEDQRVTRER